MHEALAGLHTFINIIVVVIQWIQAHWPVIYAAVGGGIGLSALAELIITKAKIDSKKVAYTLVHSLSLTAGIVAYLVAHENAFAAYGTLVIIAQTAHRFFLSDFYTKTIVPFLNWRASQSATQAALQPATEPANPFAGQE